MLEKSTRRLRAYPLPGGMSERTCTTDVVLRKENGMDFWDRMQQTLNQGLASSKDLFAKAGEKAKDLGEKGILRIEITQLEHQAEKLIAQLGKQVYEAFMKEGRKSLTMNTPGVNDLLQKIAEVEGRILEKEQALKRAAPQE